jgi:glutamate formiminotransferase/formiminotetrahydrofolate cyclodeaminase
MDRAGATVIGARAPLVAYNLYLNTDNVDIANRIARAIRHSSGGLRHVKALGLLVDGKAQVSMNLTDFTKTPIHRVQELVKSEAARHGCSVTHAELIGLIPEQALFDTARWYLQLDLFNEDQILERKLAATEQNNILPERFIEAVASGSPTPGGGSVAALAGALAAALAGMVARSTIGKKKYAEVETAMQDAAVVADSLLPELIRAISDDSQSFEQLMAAFRLPKEDMARADAIEAATIYASEVPLKTAQLALDSIKQLAIVADKGNANAVTDAAAGVHMALAAVEAAMLNVRINAKGLHDKKVANRLVKEIEAIAAESRDLAAKILLGVEKKMEAL